MHRLLESRRQREKEGLFVVEGEDLVQAADDAGFEPVELLRAGEDVEPALLDAVSALGSGTRVIGVYGQMWDAGAGGFCVYLDRVADPANLGAIIRSAHALLDAPVVVGPGSADPFGPKAVRASMGSIFARPPRRGGLDDLAPPVVALAAHGGAPPDDEPVGGLALGSEREWLPTELLGRCDRVWTIPLRGGAESLNVAATAAIALGRISSAARVDEPGGPS